MPTVPRYDQPTQQLNALPNARKAKVVTAQELAQPAEQLGQLADAGMNAGSHASDIEYQVQQRANTQQVMDAEASLKNQELQFHNQIRQRRGQNAWGATQDAQQWWGKTAQHYLSQAQNPEQRDALQKIIAQRREASLDQVSQYEAGQRRQALDDAANASLTASVNNAAASPTDPQVIQQENQSVTRTVQAQAAAQGWPADVAQQKLLKAKTQLHTAVINSLMQDHPQQALDYYKAHKDEIAGADQAQLEKELDAANLRGQSQQLADKFSGEPSLSDALAKARDVSDPKLRDETVRRVKSQFADREAAQQQSEQQASDSAWKVIAGGGQINDIPAQTWNTMTGPDQIKVQKYLAAKADKQLKGREHDDLGVYTDVQQKIEDGDIKSPEQLQRYEPYLTTSTLKTLSSAIQKNATVPQADVRRAYESRVGKTFTKIIADKSDRQNWNAFQDFVNRNVQETHRPGDLQKLADQWFMEGHDTQAQSHIYNPFTWGQGGADTFGGAVMKGETQHYVINTPDQAAPTVDKAMGLMEKAGLKLNQTDPGQTRDQIYTDFYLPAQRWLQAHQATITPQTLTAYALLKKQGQPVTPRNVEYLVQQLNKQP